MFLQISFQVFKYDLKKTSDSQFHLHASKLNPGFKCLPSQPISPPPSPLPPLTK